MKNKLRNTKGFTLIEMVVVLMIVIILIAILVPTLSRHIDSARNARAHNDVQIIAASIAQFNSDVGQWPICVLGTVVGMRGDKYELLIGPGNEPGVDQSVGIAADDTTDATGWVLALATTDKIDLISDQLNANAPGYAIGKGNRKWKGPYLSSTSGSLSDDPWGTMYLVAVKGLQVDAPYETAAYVLSAGPNMIIETPYEMVLGGPGNNESGIAPVPSGDDIWCPIK